MILIKKSLITLLSFLAVSAIAAPGDGRHGGGDHDGRPGAGNRETKYVLTDLRRHDNISTSGMNVVVRLKKQLQSQHGIRNFDDYVVSKVRVVSSDVDMGRRGRILSSVSFMLGNQAVAQARFSQGDRGRYVAEMDLQADRLRRPGTWQLHMNNYTDIRRVAVWLQRKRGGHNGGGHNPPPVLSYESLGTKRLEKWKTSFGMTVARTTRAISLRMVRNSASIYKVQAHVRGGGIVELTNLAGRYGENTIKTHRLGRNFVITHIEVFDAQSNLVGGRADVELLVAN